MKTRNLAKTRLSTPTRAALTLFAAISALNFSSAASLTWDGSNIGNTQADGGTGNWDTTTANWWDGSANVAWPAGGGTNEAIFANTGDLVFLDSGGISANKLTFNSSDYYLVGDTTLTLDGTAPTLNVASGKSATLGATASALVLAGTSGLVKTGTGTITLNGTAPATLTGGVTVRRGTLALSLANLPVPANLIPAANPLSLQGGTLSVTGSSVGSSSQTFAGTTLGSGTSTVLLNKNGGTATLTLGAITRTPGAVLNVTGATNLTATASTTEMIKVSAPATGTNGALAASVIANNPTASTGRWVAVDAAGTLRLVAAVGDVADNWAAVTNPAAVYNRFSSATLAANATAQAVQNNNTNNNTLTTALGVNTLTVNGLSCIQSGVNNLWSFTSTGAGGIKIGAEKELVLIGAGNFAFSAPIADSLGGSSGLTHAGGGTVTLNALNTYTGPTTVNSGVLQLGSLGSIDSSSGVVVNGGTFIHNLLTPLAPAVTLNGGTVSGSGTFNAITVPHASTGVLGNTGATPFTVGNLTFDGAGTVSLNTAATVPLVVTGTLVTTPANGKLSIALSGITDWGTNRNYDLISYGSWSGSISDISTSALPALGGRKTVTLASTGPTNGTIRITVSGDNALWTGVANGNWTDIPVGTPYNWKSFLNGSDTEFLPADDVIFDDTAAGTTDIIISDATVTPTSTSFNNSTKNYTVSSPGGFGIGGSTLTKNGTGTVTLNTSNTYTGGTYVNSGRLITSRALPPGTTATPVLSVGTGATLEYFHDDSVTALNQGATTFSGAGTIQKTGAGIITLGATTSTVALSGGAWIDVQAGTFKAADDTAQNTVFTANLGSLNIEAGATFEGYSSLVRVDKLTGSGTIQAGYFGPRSIMIGVNGGSSTFAGTIQNNRVGNSVGASPLVKAGTGTIALTGAINITNNTSDTNAGSDVIRVTGGTVSSPSTLTLSPVGESIIGSTVQNNNIGIAPAQNDVAVLNQTAGIINSSTVAIGNQGVGTYNFSGGTTNTKSVLMAFTGPSAGTGEAVMNVSDSATLNLHNNGKMTLGTYYGRKSTVNQTGGTVSLYSDAGVTLGGTGSLAFDGASNASAYNLLGGTLAIPNITLRAAALVDNGAGGGSGTLNFGGGTLKITSASFSIPTNAPVRTIPARSVALKVLGDGAIPASGANIDTAGNNVLLNAPLLHGGANALDGGLTKLGVGTLTLTPVASYTGPTDITTGAYTGPTVVSAGSLSVSSADFADAASVTVATGATLALNFTGADQVAGLTLGGTALPAGTYDATSHPAFISGTGSLTVVPATIPGFAAWASGLGLSGVANGDFDSDSYVDALEYVLGTDPLVTDKADITTASVGGELVVTFDRDDRSETPDIAVTVESGTDLATWPLVYNVAADTATSSAGVTIVENGTDADIVTVTIPMGGDARRFARVKVTVTP